MLLHCADNLSTAISILLKQEEKMKVIINLTSDDGTLLDRFSVAAVKGETVTELAQNIRELLEFSFEAEDENANTK